MQSRIRFRRLTQHERPPVEGIVPRSRMISCRRRFETAGQFSCCWRIFHLVLLPPNSNKNFPQGVAFGLQRNQIAMPGILGGGHPIDPSRDVVNPTAMMGGTLNVIVFVLLPPALRAWYAKKPDDSDAWLGIKDTKGQFLVQRNGEWVELDPVDLVLHFFAKERGIRSDSEGTRFFWGQGRGSGRS